MGNYIHPQIAEAVKKNIEILTADKRLSNYAFKEWLIQSALIMIWLISVVFFAVSVWALTDTSFYGVLIREYSLFTQGVLIMISIFSFPIITLSFIFSIYFSNRFDILALYRSYNVLRNKAINANEEMDLSRGKIWLVFKLNMWSILQTMHLSAIQVKNSKNMQDKSDLTFYDSTLVLPIVLFENLPKEEALKISSEINSKDLFIFIKQTYKRDFSLIGYNFKMLGLAMSVIIVLWMLFGEYLDPTLLLICTLLIFFCIQTLAMLKRRFYKEAYLVALYYAIRKNYEII